MDFIVIIMCLMAIISFCCGLIALGSYEILIGIILLIFALILIATAVAIILYYQKKFHTDLL